MSGESVCVAVRVRPFNKREKELGSTNIVHMDGTTHSTTLVDPNTGQEKQFTFDYSYDSFVPPSDPNHCSQRRVWDEIGERVLASAYEGFNVSLFAYGQTGSGKSYSMMGYPAFPVGPTSGIIPIMCKEVFTKMEALKSDENLSIKLECTMLEIYMEKVKDLLDASGSSNNLKVRNHPKKGPYVQGLSKFTVTSFEQVNAFMEIGQQQRTVAATQMNQTSSRAHTIFTLELTQTITNVTTRKVTDKTSAISLIDLAGSERAGSTGATGQRLKEGSAINQSLTALGNVISALAGAAKKGKKKKTIVPYRNSVLTMLLKNSLGGNAKTIMIAAISPASVNYAETLSTLRYADRAKQIKNKAVVNEDPNEKMIRELKEQIDKLKALAAGATASPGAARMSTTGDFQAMLAEERRKIREEERVRAQAAASASLAGAETVSRQASEGMRGGGSGGGHSTSEVNKRRKTEPHIVNLHEDSLISGRIVHFLPAGASRVGRRDAEPRPAICFNGVQILKHHCTFTLEVSGDGATKATLAAASHAKVFVNGTALGVDAPFVLHHNDRIVFGSQVHLFLFKIPAEAEAADAEDDSSFDHATAIAELHAGELERFDRGDDREQRAAKAAETHREIEKSAASLDYLREMVEKHSKKHREKMAEYKVKLGAAAGDKKKEAEIRQKISARSNKYAMEQERMEGKIGAMQREKESLQHQARAIQNRGLAEEQVLQAIPLVNEANSISQQLDEGVIFQLELSLEHFHFTAAGEVADEDVDLHVTAVRESTSENVKWTFTNFNDKLYLMREQYMAFEQMGHDLPTFRDAIAPATSAEGFDLVAEDDFQVIGRALLFLEPLSHLLSVQEQLLIMDAHGNSAGKLAVRAAPFQGRMEGEDIAKGLVRRPVSRGGSDGGGKKGRGAASSAGSSTATEVVKITDIEVDFDEIEEAEKLIGQELGILIDVRQARQLPVARCARVWIRYRWFSEAALTGDEEAPIFESEPFEKQTTNPELNFRLTHTDVVTAPYLEWLSKEILEIEVWGAVSGDEVGEVGEGGLAVGAATSSGSGAMSGAEAAKTAKTMRMLRSMHEAILRQGIVMTRLSESGGRSDKSYDVCVWIEGGGSSSSGSSSASGTESTELSICISRDGKWSSKKKSGLGPLACCFTKRRVETIPLSTITKLLKGHSTDGFRRSVVRAQPDRCMSIKHASGVVDLQAEDGNVVLFLFETIKKQMPAAVVRRGSAM